MTIASRIGLDEAGDWLLEQAAGYGLDCSHVEALRGRNRGTADPGGFHRRAHHPQAAASPDLPGDLPVEGVDCLYVNYPGTAITGYMRQMLGKSFVVAQYPKGGQARRPCHVLVASRSDLGEVSAPWLHARQLAGEQLEWLVLTEGKAGAVAIHGEEQIRVAARPVSVVDTTGAGDAFAGGLIHGLARGMAIQDALQCAVDWGAFAVASESSIPSTALKNWLKQPH